MEVLNIKLGADVYEVCIINLSHVICYQSVGDAEAVYHVLLYKSSDPLLHDCC